MFLVPEEFALPSVSLKRYLKLNTPFYPNFSNELLNACLHDFDMNEDIHLGELSMGQKKKVFMCFVGHEIFKPCCKMTRHFSW
jgi:ABC-2 type transport system ATP-binding protein